MSAVEGLKARLEQLTPRDLERVGEFLADLRAQQQRRREAVRALRGGFKSSLTPVAEFLREKHQDSENW